MSTEDNKATHPETQIVIEGQKTVIEYPQKSMSQSVVVFTMRVIIFLAILIALGYSILNWTPLGDDFKEQYRKSVEETELRLDKNTTVIRFLIVYWKRPPASYDEIEEFNISMVTHPMTIYSYQGKRLPLFYPNDGFGNKFEYSVDPQNRKITLRSAGLIGLFGTSKREISY